MGDLVLGVDGCSRGWVGILLTIDGLEALFAPTIAALEAEARTIGELAVIAIDIPIGLPDTGSRRADSMARSLLGPRSSSVFTTPVRRAVELDVYEQAAQVQLRDGGAGLTRQAFGLRMKIRDVDAWIPTASCRVVEVHPEVSFATLAGQPLPHGKATWAGAELRRSLLADVGLALPSGLGPAGTRAGVDDVLDAAVAAWTAARVRDGDAQSLPDPPESFSDGIAAAIWY